MSRRYEFLEPGAELVTDPEEMQDINEWDTFPPGEVFLVLGNPYGCATVIPGTPEQIIHTLQGFIRVVEDGIPPVVVDAVSTNPLPVEKRQQ